MTGESLLQEAKSLFASGHPAESIDYFTKAEEQGCNPVTVFLSRGAAYISIGKYKEAIEDFNRVLESDADNERALYYRGVARMNIRKFEEAVDDLTRSIGINHERGVAFLARGLALAELDREEEAVRDFKTATVFSNVEVESFMNQFGNNRTLFGKSMALLEGERGPWKYVLNEQEVEKVKKWLE